MGADGALYHAAIRVGKWKLIRELNQTWWGVPKSEEVGRCAQHETPPRAVCLCVNEPMPIPDSGFRIPDSGFDSIRHEKIEARRPNRPPPPDRATPS